MRILVCGGRDFQEIHQSALYHPPDRRAQGSAGGGMGRAVMLSKLICNLFGHAPLTNQTRLNSDRLNHVIEGIMSDECPKNSAEGCDKRSPVRFPLSAMMVLIDNLPTTIDQQIRRRCEESKRSEEALVERVRMTGALHGEVGVALVYRRGGVAPRLK